MDQNRQAVDVHFQVLGPLTVSDRNRTLALGGERRRRLLAVLLLNLNTTVPVRQVGEALWTQPPRSARQQVHNAVAGLRHTLDPLLARVRLTTVDAGYHLEADEASLDLSQFRQQLTQARRHAEAGAAVDALRLVEGALARWNGEALADLRDSPLAAAAEELDEERAAATEVAALLRLRLGESGGLVGRLARAVATYPNREVPRAALMIALYRDGRQADALSVYEQERRRLSDDFGLDPSARLRALHDEILRADGSATGVGGGYLGRALDAHGYPLGTAGPPSAAGGRGAGHLPRATADFTGRAAEMAALRRMAEPLDPAALSISVVHGMGGVGKTTLAGQVARQLADQFPDGQFFVDLHGFDPVAAPLPTEQALHSLLLQTGEASTVAAGAEERRRAWLSWTARKRILVVLDNALDTGQVQPLLPGSDVAHVIVTSRRTLSDLDGARSLELATMPLADAVGLLSTLLHPVADRAVPGPDLVAHDAVAPHAAGVDRAAQLVELARLCGQLPLALRVCAARVRSGASWSVGQLIEGLRTETGHRRLLRAGDRSVMAVIAASYRQLAEPEQSLARRLATTTGDEINLSQVAAMVDLPAEIVQEGLERLADSHLLSPCGPGRYQFAALTRECLRLLDVAAGVGDALAAGGQHPTP